VKADRFALVTRSPSVGSDGLVALIAWCSILGLALAFHGKLQFTARTLWAPALAAALGMLVCRLCGRPFWRGLGEWWPFLIMIALYMQLDPYTRLVHAQPLDAKLHALDLALFGVAPTEWLARYRHPLLTEVMALGYSSYFVLPLLSAAPSYIPTEMGPNGPRMRHREAFRGILTATVLSLFLGFLGYMLVPARGPRYFLPAPEVALRGALGYYDWAIALWNGMQEVKTDAFPSLHTATAVMAMGFSLRFRKLFRPLPWLCFPLGISLILSTVYLRMHYVVDLFAGAAVGLLAVYAGAKVADQNTLRGAA
jgi:membrane-associated phospholipid phosphatase